MDATKNITSSTYAGGKDKHHSSQVVLYSAYCICLYRDFTSEISTFTKCANNLQCIPTAHICDDEVECRDRSDELCDSKCLEVPLPPGERTIIKKCDEDSSKCIPVGQYCDGTAQCPDGSDETQAGCTCEDWGLLSCQTQEAEVTICFNTRWMTKEALSQASSHCKDFLHAIHASITPVENSKGM